MRKKVLFAIMVIVLFAGVYYVCNLNIILGIMAIFLMVSIIDKVLERYF